MKKLFFISFISFTICSFGIHKDQYIYNKFGNVKTLVKTSYLNYGETKNVEIFGKLAQILSERLKHKDTITIEFQHDTSNDYPQLLIVENGDVRLDRLIIGSGEEIKERQEDIYAGRNFRAGICIRVSDSRFDINKLLKILEYCIINKINNTLNKLYFKPTHFDNEPMPETKEILYYGLTNSQIQNILNVSNSEIFNEVSILKVVFTNMESSVKGVYENGLYTFYYKKIVFEINKLVYLIEKNEYAFIFDSKDSFVCLGQGIDKIKHINIKSNGSGPFYTGKFNHLDTSSPITDGNILLYRNFSREWSIFSFEKNKIIRRKK